jgi:hypothetical protein
MTLSPTVGEEGAVVVLRSKVRIPAPKAVVTVRVAEVEAVMVDLDAAVVV